MALSSSLRNILIFLDILLSILQIATYILINSFLKVIRTHIISLTTLSILIIILKTYNFNDISRYTFNLSLNSLLEKLLLTLNLSLFSLLLSL